MLFTIGEWGKSVDERICLTDLQPIIQAKLTFVDFCCLGIDDMSKFWMSKNQLQEDD